MSDQRLNDVRRRAVLYIHRMVLTNPTGVHRYALELATALTRQSTTFDIEFCSGRIGDDRDNEQIDGLRISHPHMRRRPLHLAWVTAHRPYLEQVLGDLDLVHLPAPVFPVPTRAAQVITIHDLLPLHHPEWYDRFPRYAFRRSVDYHLKSGAKIIAPSAYTADDISKYFRLPRENITVVPLGVDQRFAAPVDEDLADRLTRRHGLDDRPFVIAIGTIEARKNLAVVFRAMASMRANGGDPPKFAVVGGDGIGANETHALPEQLGIADLVRFTGRIDDTDLLQLLHRSVALVHPSLFEGFGLTPLEAMAGGTPAIVSNATSLGEVIGDAAVAVDPNDVPGWVSALDTVVTDADLHKRLSEAGIARAAALNWDETARRTLEVYERSAG